MVTFEQAQNSYDEACELYLGQDWFEAAQVVPDVTEGFILIILSDGVPPVAIPDRIGGTLVEVMTAPTGPIQAVTDAWLAASSINPANFVAPPPADMTELQNRMAALLVVLNGNPIP